MISNILIQDTSLLAHVLFFSLLKPKKQFIVAQSSTEVIALGVLFSVIPSGLGHCVLNHDLHSLTPITMYNDNNIATTIISHDSVPHHDAKCINIYLHYTK